ncbi:MAG: hypothetical protein JSV80_13375 [Acidobacteriota bacterium]|nr:MAG: hypothetical protein JSV80_13375 [Acidobacteriota bacterium]
MSSTTSSEQSVATLSASKLHELAIESFRIGNRGRLSLCDELRVLADTRLFHDLGHPSITAHAEAHFQLRRSETLESIRVARALQQLTRIREAFAEGRLGWSVVKAITRVASEQTEELWLRFAAEHTLEQTLAEVRDARRNSRDRPREDRFGLPNLDERWVLRFSRSEMEKIRLGCERLIE